jgi:ribonuclease BN (tRNA processing enzyme)
MELSILGCQGGIGGPQIHTTAFALDHDILLDAGTGVMDLDIPALAAINHIFLTHAHLDHVAALPLMVDTVAGLRRSAITVHGLPETLQALKTHLFNDVIWPDFSNIPSPQTPLLRFSSLKIGQPIDMGEGRTVTALPAIHSVAAVGYLVDSGEGCMAFSGDTAPCKGFFEAINREPRLQGLIMECAFPDEKGWLAKLSSHLCPESLLENLRYWEPGNATLYISHLKPGQQDLIEEQIKMALGEKYPFRILENGQHFRF